MATDLQSRVTQIYTRLVALDASISQRAYTTRINTLQNTLTSTMNTLSSSLATAEEQIKDIQNTLADVIAELRSKE